MDSQRLIAHIREHSRPMEPVPTREAARVDPLPGIRAIVFDVYGTLFISGSGDISLAEGENRSPAIIAALETAGYRVDWPEADWSRAFMDTLARFREARHSQGIEFPEVRIEEVWAAFIEAAREQDWLSGTGDLLLAIVDHECRVNPCWPMPGLEEILDWLAARNLKRGIVSNAQFYTPLLFAALSGKALPESGFDERISVWSYREREGKPSEDLYRKLKEGLQEMGIRPAETLYVGNDVRNDIRPAAALGFRTALFAGDQRSLRWRSDDPGCQSVHPDRILTDLRQLRELIR